MSGSLGRKRMRHLAMIFAMCFAVALGTDLGPVLAESPEDAAQRLVGMWRLVSITTNGQLNPDRGPHPTGFIVYDKSGNMSVQIMPDRLRTKAGQQLTPDEAKAALIGYTAYFGTYDVDPKAGTVTHHRKGNVIPGAPADVVRRFEFVGNDRVVLRPVENANELTWERVK
jgi:hypothetical protein